MGMGMTNAKFRRRYKLMCWILGCSETGFIKKYAHLGIRSKYRTRMTDGKFPFYKDQDIVCAVMGITRQVFCGPEPAFIEALRRRRAWELGINTSTWLSLEDE